MIEERVTKVEITMAEVSTDLKHIVKKLDEVVDRMEKFGTTFEEVAVLKNRMEAIEKENKALATQVSTNTKKVATIASGLASMTFIVVEVLRNLVL